MNATQMTAIRNLWTEVNTEKTEMTAREMALTPTRAMSRDGNMVITEDGKSWVWVQTTERWTLWRPR